MKTTLLLSLISTTLFTTAQDSSANKSTPAEPATTLPAKSSPAKKATNWQSKAWAVDFYGTTPFDFKGGGVGFGYFSPALNNNIGLGFMKPEVRLGFDLFFVETAHKTFYNIPLNAPQTGDARVRLSQTQGSFNFSARISAPYSQKVIPYVDVFGGWRTFSASMNITPNQRQPGYESSSSSTLSWAGHLNYGAAAGLMFSLGQYVKFNTALLYSTSQANAQVSDVAHAQNSAGGIITQKINTPKNVLTLKVGFTFVIEKGWGSRSSCGCRHTGGGRIWTGGSGGGLKTNTIRVISAPRT